MKASEIANTLLDMVRRSQTDFEVDFSISVDGLPCTFEEFKRCIPNGESKPFPAFRWDKARQEHQTSVIEWNTYRPNDDRLVCDAVYLLRVHGFLGSRVGLLTENGFVSALTRAPIADEDIISWADLP